MKTAEEWANEVISDAKEAEWSVRPLIGQIQLDAAKRGMKQAARLSNELIAMAKCDISCPCRESVKAYEEAILVAANNLTIDQLNK